MSHDTASPEPEEILWEQLAPHLDQAVAALSEADRSAILLRFYEKMPLRGITPRIKRQLSKTSLYHSPYDPGGYYGPTVRRKYLALVPLIELVTQRERLVGALEKSISLIQLPALRLPRH